MIMSVRTLSLSILLSLSCNMSISQSVYYTSGDAFSVGIDTFQLTLDAQWSNGAVWHKLKHDFNNPFEIYGKMFFGDSEDGADGIVFVIQNQCLVAGTAGVGIGYQGMLGNSLGVEFDSFRNIGGTTNDPVEDHIGIHQNGSVNHLTNIAGPVQMSATQTNVEDNLWHGFAIVYDPGTFTLDVYFDGSLRLSTNVDVPTVLGTSFSYWGFTSATGGNFADNSVVIDSVTAFTLTDTVICPGSAVVDLPTLEYGNSAIGAPTTASSVEGAFVATNATDGSFGSRWSSVFMDPQWITVDLGTSMVIDSVALHWEGAFGMEYYIQTSNDNVVWTDQFHETSGNGGLDEISITPVSARYVRMFGVQRGTVFGYSLWEFEVFTQPEYAWSPNNGTISDTTSNNPTFTPSVTTTYTLTIPDPCLGSTDLDYTVFVDCTILPVEEMYLQGYLTQNRTNYLYWHTTTEINNDYFQIQRSENLQDWNAVGVVNGVGNSSQMQYYYFEDSNLNWDLNGYYYRLEQFDYNGVSAFSNIIFIPLESKDDLTVFPNPVGQNMVITGIEEGITFVELFDMKGSLVRRFDLDENVSSGDAKLIDISSISSGVYFLRAGTQTIRLLKN